MGEEERILIVDLDEEHTQSLKLNLEDSLKGLTVDTAKDPEQAEGLIEKNSYRVILIEPFRSDYRGRESENPNFPFVREIRRRNIPVILQTTQAEEDLRKCGLERADYHTIVSKPFWVDELVPILRKVMGE